MSYSLSYNYLGSTPSYSYTQVGSYDAVGRVLTQSQQLLANSAWQVFNLSRTYDIAGHVTGQTYPSSHTVSYAYGVGGRTSSFGGTLGGSSYTYADTLTYTAAGQVSGERFGTSTNRYQANTYNSRLQLAEVYLGTTLGNWNRGALSFYYGAQIRAAGDPYATTTDNNGNLSMQQHWVPYDDAISLFTLSEDRYEYDALNRISSITESQRAVIGAVTSNVVDQGFSYVTEPSYGFN